MSYWNSSDGIEGTSRELSHPEMRKCGCGCREYFLEDETFRHEDGEIIAFAHEDAYNELIKKENELPS